VRCAYACSFGYNYIVPIPKVKDCYSKRLTVNEFRDIAISCMLSNSKVYRPMSHVFMIGLKTFCQAPKTNLYNYLCRRHLYSITVISLSEVQNILHKCETELKWLGMAINANKSYCLRIGRRCNAPCSSITTSDVAISDIVGDGISLPRHLYCIQSPKFRCSTHEHKSRF